MEAKFTSHLQCKVKRGAINTPTSSNLPSTSIYTFSTSTSDSISTSTPTSASTIADMMSTGGVNTDTITNDAPVSNFKPLEQFTRYPNLAPKLRILIWERSLQARVVTFDYAPGLRHRTRISANIPAILQANREARAVGLKYYKTCFSSLDGHPCYFNASKDVLHLTSVAAFFIDQLPSKFKEELESVRNIACTATPRYFEVQRMENHLARLIFFPSLEVYLVGHDNLEVMKKAKEAATIWVRKMNEKQSVKEGDRGIKKETTI